MYLKQIIFALSLLSSLAFADTQEFKPVTADGKPATYREAFQSCASQFNKLAIDYNQLYSDINQCQNQDHSEAYYRDQADQRRAFLELRRINGGDTGM